MSNLLGGRCERYLWPSSSACLFGRWRYGLAILLDQKFGGFVVAGAIDKYVYMLVHTTFQQRYRMKYSEIER